MSMVSENVELIIQKIQELEKRVRKSDDEDDYKNWIEGILQSAIAVLNVAR